MTKKKKLVFAGVWVALIVAAILWVRCGNGWGIGGRGEGNGSGIGTGKGTAEKKCDVRVSAKGIELEGKVTTRDEVVAKCKQGADVVVTGDAREGDWAELQRAFDAANERYFVTPLGKSNQ